LAGIRPKVERFEKVNKRTLAFAMLLALMCVLTFGCGLEGSATNPSAQPSSTPQPKPYVIVPLVPDEVYMVALPAEYYTPAAPLAEGVIELGKTYIIKSLTPIARKPDQTYGSATEALIVLVELRSKATPSEKPR